MILRQAKNPQSGRACAPGGSARQEAGDPPPLGRAVEFLNAVGREAPCGPSGRLRVRMRARDGGAGGRESVRRHTCGADRICGEWAVPRACRFNPRLRIGGYMRFYDTENPGARNRAGVVWFRGPQAGRAVPGAGPPQAVGPAPSAGVATRGPPSAGAAVHRSR